MGLKFEYGPSGPHLMSLLADEIHDGECVYTGVFAQGVLFTVDTLRKHQDRLLPEHFQGLTDGGLILRVEDEYATVEVYPDKDALTEAWNTLVRSSITFKDQRLTKLDLRNMALAGILAEAVDRWPQLDGDGDVACADLYEWFMLWRKSAKACLAAAMTDEPRPNPTTQPT